MNITAAVRRNTLKLFNVSEAARKLGLSVRKMHWEIAVGRVPSPQVKLGKRLYFTADDLVILQRRLPTKDHS